MLEPVEKTSPHAFDATTARIVDAVEGAGMTVFARIDHAAAAKAAGLEMPPTTVLLFGNPAVGTPLMLAVPNVALDLPLRVLIRETVSGQVEVVFHPVGSSMLSAGLSADMATTLQPAQQLILRAIESGDDAAIR